MAQDTGTKPSRTEVVQPTLGFVGWVRWTWRQLTSMRTALFLLLLLAVGAVPGSIWPQRSIDAARTADYIARHPDVGPWMDRLGLFDVYASPWFSAIYLLLFISLVGCILPRTRLHWRTIRSAPPRAPKRPERLPAHAEDMLLGTREDVLTAARVALRERRFRVHSHDEGSVSAESGYLKETGNLVFHIALVLIIIGVAVGHLFGWKGDVIIPEGATVANTFSRYDAVSPGPWVDAEDLEPFIMTVDDFEAHFEDDPSLGPRQFGQPREFAAHVTTRATPDAEPEQHTIKVNDPLDVGDATAFLLGNGYAPVITVRDADGDILYTGATPFIPQNDVYRSVGAIKVPAAEPKQLGFVGLFLPTAVITEGTGPTSVFPDAREPALALSLYEGELFPGGRPQSVYTLDTSQMEKVLNEAGDDATRIWLEPGDTAQLPGDRGSITFEEVRRFAGISVREDPGKELTLVSSLLALGGLILTLTIRRRRVFVRVDDGAEPGTVAVRVGGLAKDDDDGLQERVQQVLASMRESGTR